MKMELAGKEKELRGGSCMAEEDDPQREQLKDEGLNRLIARKHFQHGVCVRGVSLLMLISRLTLTVRPVKSAARHNSASARHNAGQSSAGSKPVKTTTSN